MTMPADCEPGDSCSMSNDYPIFNATASLTYFNSSQGVTMYYGGGTVWGFDSTDTVPLPGSGVQIHHQSFVTVYKTQGESMLMESLV